MNPNNDQERREIAEALARAIESYFGLNTESNDIPIYVVQRSVFISGSWHLNQVGTPEEADKVLDEWEANHAPNNMHHL